MILLLMVLMLPSQVPCHPGETTTVCHCKQGSASACEALRQVDPARAAEIEKALARNQTAAPEATGAKGQQPQVPRTAIKATGQEHHAISKKIAESLNGHKTLRGKYSYRDPRFVTRAKDKAAHNGYQDWHRRTDEEVVNWLKSHGDAALSEFELFLRQLYSRPDVLKRFPNGL